MQPMLAIVASRPGVIYINGSFAGEAEDGQPLLRPVNSRGAVYLEYRPLEDGYRPMARRLVFSGGRILQESADAAEGISIVLWPGGVTELELSPAPWEALRTAFSSSGYNFSMEGCGEAKLFCEGRLLCTLPHGAQQPQLRPTEDGFALLGQCTGGMYLFTADRDMRGITGFLQAQEIEIGPDGQVRALVDPGDTVGHGSLEQWRIVPGGLTLLSSQGTWVRGAPQWPRTPQDTVLAAVEAALAGLDGEAEGYLSPPLRRQHPLDAIAGEYDLCVRMKYGPQGAQAGAGLLRLEGGNMASVVPLRFRACPGDGRQGPYQLEELAPEPDHA